MTQGIKTQTQVDPITETEYSLIVQKAQEAPDPATLRADIDIAIIGLMRDAVLRPREAIAARWSDLQRAEEDGSGRLTVRPSQTARSGKDTFAYVSPRTMKALDEMRRIEKDRDIDATDGLILHMTRRQLSRHIRTACETARLLGNYNAESPRLGAMMDLMRSGFGTLHLMQAARLKSQALLGHPIPILPDGLTAVKPLYTRTMPIQTATAAMERLQSRMQNEGSSE